jgi:protein-disulfide isomerase
LSKLSIAVSSKDHIQGQADAKITLVEYGDYECPSCGQAYPIVKRVQKHFAKRLAFVFRNFPLSQMHPYAEAAAETAEFAASHNKFWEMHDLLYENQDRLDEELLSTLTEELGLDPSELQKALKSKAFQAHMKADFSAGVLSGVNGTPTFFINGQRHDASYDYDSLVDAIEGASTSE